MWEPLNHIGFQGSLNTAAPLLSPSSQASLDAGSWNSIVSGDGLVRGWGGATSQGSGTGAAKMVPFGSTWGAIKSYSYADKTFSAPGAVGTNQVTVASTSDWVTGMPCTISGSAVLPTGLSPSPTIYYTIIIDATTLAFADSVDHALLGTAVPITASTGLGTITIDVSNAAVTASGNWMQDIGLSRWGIGTGQPMIEGVPVPGFALSTNLQVQIAVNGVYGAPVQAGLSQPSAPGLAIIPTTGVISNSMSAKIARSRPSTGAISVASPSSVVVTPQSNRLRLGPFPAASVGQTHWRAYFTFQGFGGTGVNYLTPYNGVTDIPESVVAAGLVSGAQATGAIYVGINPSPGETIVINGVTFTFISGVSTTTDIQIGADQNSTAANIVSVLNASIFSQIDVATYSAVTYVVTVTYKTEGIEGNTFTLAQSSGANVTVSGALLSGGVDGIGRTLEFNFQDGDMIPIEASYSDYPPPAATHALRLNTVMNLPGCYGDTANVSSTNTGTCIAVSKENNYESYVPTSLLYLPEQVVDVLARPLDDYGYIGCVNSIHAIQYVGNRGDELPSCTLTTVLPDVGIQYQQNWCHSRGQLVVYTVQGVLMRMDEGGAWDTTWANPVTKILKTFTTAETSIAYDPNNDSDVVMNGHQMLVYSRQTQIWRQIFLPDYGLTGTCLPSGVAAKRDLYFSMTEGGVETAYTYDTADAIAPLSFVCNYQNAGGLVVDDISEMACAAQTTMATKFAVVINKNLTKTVFRYATAPISGNPSLPYPVLLDDSGNALVDSNNKAIVDDQMSKGILLDAEGTFYPGMVGKRYILFGTDVGGAGTVLIQGTITMYYSRFQVQMSVGSQASVTNALLFVGDYASAVDFDEATQFANFFPNVVEARSYQIACWLQSTGDAGNVLAVDVAGTRYASSRAPS